MKLLRNLSLGLAVGALTAATALLGSAQPASAQGAPPGFLQLPGTNISLLITGQVGTRVIYDSVQTGYPAYYESQADALVPIFIGVGPQTLANTGHTGSIHFSSTDANIGFITATHTSWGELQTVLILATSSDNNLAYGPPGVTNFSTTINPLLGFATLGPLMVGLNTSLFGDDDANPTADTMNEPLAVSGVAGGIQPSIRYTFVGAGGFSLAGSVENPVTTGISGMPVGNFDNVIWPSNFIYPGPGCPSGGGAGCGGGVWGPDQPFSTGTLNGVNTIPDFVLAARLDQPWGHIRIAGMLHFLNSSCNENCGPYGIAGITPPGTLPGLPDVHKTGWGVNITGHLNTFGKDKLMAGFVFGQGLDHYLGEFANTGLMVGPNVADTGFVSAIPFAYGGYVAYKHFWTDQLRSTLAFGAAHVDPEFGVFNGGTLYNSVASGVVNQLIYQTDHWSLTANLIWSPVNNVDLGAQVIYYHVTTAQAGSNNTYDNNGHDVRVEVGGAIRF
jgi:Porin subfamily